MSPVLLSSIGLPTACPAWTVTVFPSNFILASSLGSGKRESNVIPFHQCYFLVVIADFADLGKSWGILQIYGRVEGFYRFTETLRDFTDLWKSWGILQIYGRVEGFYRFTEELRDFTDLQKSWGISQIYGRVEGFHRFTEELRDFSDLRKRWGILQIYGRVEGFESLPGSVHPLPQTLSYPGGAALKSSSVVSYVLPRATSDSRAKVVWLSPWNLRLWLWPAQVNSRKESWKTSDGLSPSYNNSRCVYLNMFIFFLSPVLWLPL